MTAAGRITCDACAAGRNGCTGWIRAGSLRLPCEGPPGDSSREQRHRAWLAAKQRTPILNSHNRKGQARYPCGTCGRGRMQTHYSRGDLAVGHTCPVCDGTGGLEPADVGVWAWKYGIPLDQLYARPEPSAGPEVAL